MTYNQSSDLFTYTTSFEAIPPGGWASPFYYDNAGDLNFGYGYDLTKNASTFAGTFVLAGVTLPAAAQALVVANLASPPAAGASRVTAAQNINSAMGGSSWEAQVVALTLWYLNNVAYVKVTNTLLACGIDVNAAPVGVICGLTDLVYNANSALDAGKIPGLLTDIAAKDWGSAAFDISFNDNVTVPGLQARRVGEAMLMLGFIPQMDRNHQVASLVVNSVKDGEIVSYLKKIANASGNPINGSQTAAIDQLESYTIGQGYYVVQEGDTASSIATTISADTKFTIDGPTLQRVNDDLFNQSGSITKGAVIYAPVAQTDVSGGLTALPSSDGQVLVVDSASGSLVTCRSDLPGGTAAPPADSNAGKLLLDAFPGFKVDTKIVTSVMANGANHVVLSLGKWNATLSINTTDRSGSLTVDNKTIDMAAGTIQSVTTAADGTPLLNLSGGSAKCSIGIDSENFFILNSGNTSDHVNTYVWNNIQFDKGGFKTPMGDPFGTVLLDASSGDVSAVDLADGLTFDLGVQPNVTQSGGALLQTLTGGPGADTLIASPTADTIIGASGNESLYAGSADATLVGGHGDNAAWGGAGNDVIIGGLGNNTVSGVLRPRP